LSLPNAHNTLWFRRHTSQRKIGEEPASLSPGAARAAPNPRDHRPPSTSSPSLAVAGGLRRAKLGRSGGGRALFLSSAGGYCGRAGDLVGSRRCDCSRRWPSGPYGLLAVVAMMRRASWARRQEASCSAAQARSGPCGLDLGLAGPSRHVGMGGARRGVPRCCWHRGFSRCAWRLQLPSRCSGQLVGAAPPTACGWWRLVCISGVGVPAEGEDAGAAAPGARAFSSLLRRERVWREATRREVMRCGLPW
jgi:hypothetical protein